MFLAQNFKKFLKKTLQESKAANTERQDLFQVMKEFDRGCGLDPDNPATSPAFYELEGNAWHNALSDD